MALHHRLQDRVARLLGVAPDQRSRRLAELLSPRRGDAAGYWLQLSISVLIATLGLAQGSTAVVIGAMLIAPLMQPIIELGFGVALGSTALTVRAAVRFAGSLGLALVASALITHGLPFHEVTPELQARTSPTMLDLFVAAACALAAVYTTVHNSGDTASAAAGTAIGISLVPPLCTAGWGLGTSNWAVARGAALLFTANFTAIVVLTAASALALGFGQHARATLAAAARRDGDGDGDGVRGVDRALGRVLGGRLALALRILLPVALLAAIYVPLRAALSEVAWQSSARAEVSAVLHPYADRFVRQSMEIRGGKIRLTLIAIGERTANEQALASIRDDIRRRTGTVPRIDAVYVPDAEALASVAASLPAPELVAAPAPPPPPPPAGPGFVAAVDDLLATRWPEAGGELLATRVALGAPLVIELVHLGPAIGPAARELLTPELTHALGAPVTVSERSLPSQPRTLTAPSALELDAWLADALTAIEVARGLDLRLCLEAPAPPRRGLDRTAAQRALVLALLERSSAGLEHELAATDRWAFHFARSCQPTAPADR